MRFEELLRFLEHEMRMSHVYQPVMIRVLLDRSGHAAIPDIANALLQQDRSQLDYYEDITKNMVGRVLTNRGVVRRDGARYELLGFDELTPDQVEHLKTVCDVKLGEYVTKRGIAIWEHRSRGAYFISGTIRYEVLKDAKFHCELCGISADERALEVDHILPRSKGGKDEISNYQALCYSCNAMKRDRDDTDLREVRASYTVHRADCPFCLTGSREIVAENSLAFATRDLFPVSPWHVLVIPKRHVSDYYALGMPEVRACQQLLRDTRAMVLSRDDSISGFNTGINSGEAAGQTVMHCHIHLIPRRDGDNPNPRGGVRNVIPGKADY